MQICTAWLICNEKYVGGLYFSNDHFGLKCYITSLVSAFKYGNNNTSSIHSFSVTNAKKTFTYWVISVWASGRRKCCTSPCYVLNQKDYVHMKLYKYIKHLKFPVILATEWKKVFSQNCLSSGTYFACLCRDPKEGTLCWELGHALPNK